MDKESKVICELVLSVGVTVFGLLLLNIVLGTAQTLAPIWSLSGFGVMFGIAFIQIVFQTLLKKIGIVKLLKGVFLMIAFVYVVGILLGSVILREFGFEATVTPIWSDAGFCISYWVTFVAWASSKLLLK